MLLRRLPDDRRGSSGVEFALIAPVLAVMVVGMSDLVMGISRKYELEQAGYRALEMVTAGSLQTDYVAYLKPEAAAAAGVPPANVTVTNWLECDGAKQESFAATCPATQETARFVRVQIVTDYEPAFSYLAKLNGGTDGKIPLKTRSTLRVQ